MDLHPARRDLLAGGIFAAFGAAFAAISLTYEVGDPFRMGPGFFPLALGILLVGLGALIVVKGFVAASGEGLGIVPWRAIALVVVALLFFGITVRGLGLVPALAVTTLLAAFAGHDVRPARAVLIAAGLTVLSVLVFVVALQLRLALFGTWIPL